jgi:hypothetical protein
MGANEGELHVIGSIHKRKQEKNLADNRKSIPAVCVGSAAGVDGPCFYLAKGKTKEINLPSFKDFTANYKAPAGTHVIMTPNAYMTDEAWDEVVPFLCEGICKMNGIKDNKDWWVVLSLDGFGSHLGPDALLELNRHKILVVKEEGDTSHLSQAYDQMVTRSDKRKFRESVDNVKTYHKSILNQWDIILIVNVNEAFKNAVAKTDAWRKSFIRVNFCPSKRKPFAEWLEKHKGTVEAADYYFKSRNGICTMQCWPAGKI